MYSHLLPPSTALKPENIHPKPERLWSGKSSSRMGMSQMSSGRKPPINVLSQSFKSNKSASKSKPPRIRSAMPQMTRKIPRRVETEKSLIETEKPTYKTTQLNIKTRNNMMPERSCLSSKSRSTNGLLSTQSK